MIDDALAKAVVEKYTDEQVLDGVIEVLVLAQNLLDPSKTAGNIEFCSGVAMQEVVHATKVLRAYREKKHGVKPPTIL